jgi:protocatechuate 3,4-dioxygenase beta subunit
VAKVGIYQVSLSSSDGIANTDTNSATGVAVLANTPTNLELNLGTQAIGTLTLSGTIEDALGAVVPYGTASIKMKSATRELYCSAYPDDLGVYLRTCAVYADTYTVSISQNDSDGNLQQAILPNPVVIRANQDNPQTLDLTYATTGTLEVSGVVKRSNGSPVTNRAVYGWLAGRYVNTTTDSQGRYVVSTAILAGQYEADIRTNNLDDYDQKRVTASNLVVQNGQTNQVTLDLVLDQVTQIKVTGTLRDTAGQPVAGRSIWVNFYSQTRSYNNYIDSASDGTYSIERYVKSGTYEISLSSWDGIAKTDTATASNVELLPEQSITKAIDLSTQARGTITMSGQVTDSQGNSVAYQSAYLRFTKDGQVTSCNAYANELGVYERRCTLYTGSYTVEIVMTDSNGLEQKASLPNPITIIANQNINQTLNLTYAATGTLVVSGMLTKSNNTPINGSGEYIDYIIENAEYRYADRKYGISNGNYSFSKVLRVGTYRVEIRRYNYDLGDWQSEVAENVVVAANQNNPATLNMRLKAAPKLHLSGRILESDGVTGVANKSVLIRTENGGIYTSTTTDANGDYDITGNIRPGQTNLSIVVNRFETDKSASMPINLIADQTTTASLNLILDPIGTIQVSGIVRDSNNQPIANTAVYLRLENQGSESNSVQTDANGQYLVSLKAPLGTYSLVVTADHPTNGFPAINQSSITFSSTAPITRNINLNFLGNGEITISGTVLYASGATLGSTSVSVELKNEFGVTQYRDINVNETTGEYTTTFEVQAGSYTAKVSYSDYQYYRDYESTSSVISLAVGNTEARVLNITVSDPVKLNLQGIVRDTAGQIMVGAEARFYVSYGHSYNYFSATTDVNGQYSVQVILPPNSTSQYLSANITPANGQYYDERQDSFTVQITGNPTNLTQNLTYRN